jgi:D-glycero-D-manno-heptose 1,7-bisphosphate phosphatase
MLTAAANLLRIDLPRSWIVGDRASDIAAGRNAGLAGGLHVTSGWGSEPGEQATAMALAAPRAGFCVLAADGVGAAPVVLPLFPGQEGLPPPR